MPSTSWIWIILAQSHLLNLEITSSKDIVKKFVGQDMFKKVNQKNLISLTLKNFSKKHSSFSDKLFLQKWLMLSLKLLIETMTGGLAEDNSMMSSNSLPRRSQKKKINGGRLG